MTDMLVLDLVDKGLATDQMVLTIGYDRENLSDPEIAKHYHGPVTMDHYGRPVPKHAHGTTNFKMHTSSTEEIMDQAIALFDRIINPALMVRRVNISVNNLISESKRNEEAKSEQLDFFTDYEKADEEKKEAETKYRREKSKQNAMITIKKKFGGNAIIKGMNLEQGATTIDRNKQIGGHRA